MRITPVKPLTNERVSRIADIVADEIERKWCQGAAFYGPEEEPTQVCLGQAIVMGTSEVLGARLIWQGKDDNDDGEVKRPVQKMFAIFKAAINEQYPWPVYRPSGEWGIVRWNDDFSRKQTEVADLARRIAKDYRIKADEEGEE